MSTYDSEEEYALPLVPGEAETMLALRLGALGLRIIDGNLVRHTQRRSQKVFRVVCHAMKAGAFSLQDEACFELHVRRLIGLVDRGVLIGLGNLRRPGHSEVCLPG